MFSFIDAVGSIQDAFAQCIGGLLSVVAQDMQLSVECVAGGVVLESIRSGSYVNRVAGDGRGGFVEGDPVMVPRQAAPVSEAMSPLVEREWHRIHAAKDMAAARAAAEENDFACVASILETRRRALESCALL
jgi:hypothetical protein